MLKLLPDGAFQVPPEKFTVALLAVVDPIRVSPAVVVRLPPVIVRVLVPVPLLPSQNELEVVSDAPEDITNLLPPVAVSDVMLVTALFKVTVPPLLMITAALGTPVGVQLEPVAQLPDAVFQVVCA